MSDTRPGSRLCPCSDFRHAAHCVQFTTGDDRKIEILLLRKREQRMKREDRERERQYTSTGVLPRCFLISLLHCGVVMSACRALSTYVSLLGATYIQGGRERREHLDSSDIAYGPNRDQIHSDDDTRNRHISKTQLQERKGVIFE